MNKRVAILQSNYIPWKGYFDLLSSVDEFIVYDDMQFTKNDWRNRNKIKTPHGPKWLTVPVKTSGMFGQTIRETIIDGEGWASKHWNSLVANYGKAPHFAEVSSLLKPAYDAHHTSISDLNTSLMKKVADYLDIKTQITFCWDYGLVDGKTERLVDLCQKAGAKIYVSGPAARGYLQEPLFAQAGIEVRWFDYSGYPEYPQLWGSFEHAVSVVDLLFNCGPVSGRYLKRIA